MFHIRSLDEPGVVGTIGAATPRRLRGAPYSPRVFREHVSKQKLYRTFVEFEYLEARTAETSLA